MTRLSNIEIREKIRTNGLTHYQVAEKIGVSEFTFSRWMRKELPIGKKTIVFKAICELSDSDQGRDG